MVSAGCKLAKEKPTMESEFIVYLSYKSNRHLSQVWQKSKKLWSWVVTSRKEKVVRSSWKNQKDMSAASIGSTKDALEFRETLQK